jgi:hypothetical protein
MDAYEQTGSSMFPSPAALSNTSGGLGDELALDPRFQELQTTLRTYLLEEVRSTDNTRPQTPDNAPRDHLDKQGHELLLQHLAQCKDQIPLSRKLTYLNAWICECAPWLDMFDEDQHFGIHIPLIAQNSPAVFFALLALGARQVERKRGAEHLYQDSLELYSQAISSLTPSLATTTDLDVPVTACILCVLEMMSASPKDWRRHLEGCAAIFAHLGINGFSGGLLQAVFWCYARMDLCASIISNGEQSTNLTIDKWAVLDPIATGDLRHRQDLINSTFLEKALQVTDMYANHAVYLCASVCDLLAQRTRALELGEDNGYSYESFNARWHSLEADLQQWYTQRSPQMLPVKEINGSQDTNLFPRILFAHWAAISGNQLYHTACILMTEMQPEVPSSSSTGSSNTLWHARRIVGISLTNHHPGCLNNAIQPLFIAGKQFTHQSEHEVVVDLLRHIEVCSGWGSRWRIKDLESYWGYRPGTYYLRKRPREAGA